ncbi:MAG: acyl-CoA dehydrogenase, partial [Pseudomonadota bacterium]
MTALILIALCFVALFTLAFVRAPLAAWAAAAAAIALAATSNLFSGPVTAPSMGVGTILAFLPAVILGLLSIKPIRLALLTAPVFGVIKRMLPPVSSTEQEALDAGTVGWDAELFSGKPDWSKLQAIAGVELTEEEAAFLNGPTEELCAMISDWDVR